MSDVPVQNCTKSTHSLWCLSKRYNYIHQKFIRLVHRNSSVELYDKIDILFSVQRNKCHSASDASLTANNTNDFWLSVWTIGGPLNGDTWYMDGYTAGRNAANEIMGLNGSYVPTYLILDDEGIYAPPTTTTHWDNWLNGWAEGIRSVSLLVSPAYYASQSLMGTYSLLSLAQAAFPAITSGTAPYNFIQTESAGTPVWSSIYGNDSVSGYMGYYAYCHGGYPNSCPPYSAGSATTDVESWRGAYSTAQFVDSGVDCAPSQASGSGG